MPPQIASSPVGRAPITGAVLASAIEAHNIYVEKLEQWHDWLMGGYQPSNADQLMLYQLIRLMLKLRSPGGDWEHEVRDGIPTLDEMRDAIAHNDPDSPYRRFEAQIQNLREQIEVAAHQLVQLLNSEELIDEFDTLTLDQQAMYATAFSDHLAASENGLSFLVSASTEPHPSGKQHVLNVDRFLTTPGDFVSANTGVARRLAKAYAEFYFKTLPALMKDDDIARFTGRTLNFIFKYFPRDAQLLAERQAVFDGVLGLEKFLVKIRIFAEDHPEIFSSHHKGVTRTCGSCMVGWRRRSVEHQGVFWDNWRYHPTSYDQEHNHGTQHRGNCTPAATRL